MDFRKSILLVSILLFAVYGLNAQVNGYRGKRFLLKTDLATVLLEKGYKAELEAVLFRDISLSLSYAKRVKTDYINKYVPQDTTSFVTRDFGGKLRFYWNKAIPAPLGVYSSISYRTGKTQIESRKLDVVETPFGNEGQLYKYNVYQVDDAFYYQFGLGWGYQSIFAERISLDAGWKVVFSLTNAGIYSNIIDATGNGHNLLHFNKDANRNNHNWGLSAHLSIGVLLF